MLFVDFGGSVGKSGDDSENCAVQAFAGTCRLADRQHTPTRDRPGCIISAMPYSAKCHLA